MHPVDALFAGAPHTPATGTAAPQQPHAAVDALFAGSGDAAKTASKPGALDYLKDVVGIPASALGSAVTVPLAGYAGALGTMLPGAPGQGARVTQRIEDATSYRARTPLGQDAQSVLGWIPSKLAALGDAAGRTTSAALSKVGLPTPLAAGTGATLNSAIQVAPMFVDRLLGIAPKIPVEASRVAPPVAAARAAGFKLTPNEAMARGAGLGRVAESLAGHAKLERGVSRANAPIVTDVAARDVGINGPVNAESIAAAKAVPNSVYDEVSQLGQIPTDAAYRGVVSGSRAPGVASFPKAADARIAGLREAYSVPSFDAGDAIAKIRELRQEGNARVYGGKYDPAESAYGHAQLAISRALENQIDRHLQSLASGERPGPVTLDQAPLSNNASGESAASEEAVNRTAAERAAGRDRFLIDSDGRATPLIGVDAADARAPAGSLIVQRGVGAQPLTILDRGGLPATQARGLLNRAQQLHGLTADEGEPIGARPETAPTQRAPSSARADWAAQASDLIPRYRAARAALAKINNFERAWRGGQGEGVSAKSLAKQLDRGAPLTGGLRTIAEAAQRFPRAFQDLHKIRDNGPFSNLDLKIAGPLAFLKPEALLPFLGPPGIRALLGSDRYQRRAFGPFKSPAAPLFSALNKSMLPVTAGSARSGSPQR